MSRQKQTGELIPMECLKAQAELVERNMNDGPIDNKRETALLAHLEVCEDCSDFDRIIRHLGDLPPKATGEAGSRLARAARVEYFQRREKQRTALRWGAVAAAAVLVLALHPLLFSSKETTTNGEQKVTTGERVHMFGDRVTLFASKQTQLRTVLTKPNTMHVRLDSGFVCANIKPDSNHRFHFRVITKAGNVDIKGTAFGVTASDDEVRVEVVRGEVEVAALGSDRPFSVHAGNVFDIGTRRTKKIDSASAKRIRGLLGMIKMNTQAPITKEPEIIAKEILPSEPSSEETEDASLPAMPTSFTKPRLPRSSLKALIDEATECRIDRKWDCVAKRYESVIKRFPQSAEATTALVTLGQIQLGHLRRPLLARRNFEQYQKLRPSGPLSEQALYGIARASMALGDSLKEKQALERFIALHPSSPLTGPARERLSELGKK